MKDKTAFIELVNSLANGDDWQYKPGIAWHEWLPLDLDGLMNVVFADIEVRRKPEPEYREPVMPDDYGKIIEVRDSNALAWWKDKLYGKRPENEYPWVTADNMFKYARIEVAS